MPVIIGFSVKTFGYFSEAIINVSYHHLKKETYKYSVRKLTSNDKISIEVKA